ncbi:MAG: hypothetical protein ABIK23_02395 [candidate division WOR-3 bacterium]
MAKMNNVLLLLIIVMIGSATEWDSIIRLTDNNRTQVLGLSYQKSIAVDPDGNVWVFWQDQRSTPYQIWLRKFDRVNRIWLPESQLTRISAQANPPSAACDQSGNVHLAWHIEGGQYAGIWYKKYDKSQGRWLGDTLLVPAVLPYLRKNPVIATQLGGNAVHIVWFGNPDTGGLYQVFHKEYRPTSGWLPYEQVSSAICPHEAAAVAVDSNNNLAVVWLGQDFGSQRNQVFCRRRIDSVWQNVEQVSEFPGDLAQYSPCVAVSANGNWHVVWEGTVTGQMYRQIYHRLRTPNGWSQIFMVSRGVSYQQGTPSASCREENECHIVWRGKTQASPDNFQLCYSFRDKYGNWSLPEQLTEIDTGNVDRPALVCDSGYGLHIVYQDESSGNIDVYYLYGWIAGIGIFEGRPKWHNKRLRIQRAMPKFLDGANVYNSLGQLTGKIGSRIGSGIYLIETNNKGCRRIEKVVVFRESR